jgi:hypothetical protein
MTAGPPSLRASLESAAEALGDVERVEDGDAIELRRAGRAFARVADGWASYRLDATLVAAALRTPDATSSDQGPEWVVFAPPELDGFALDRAIAWLEAAWRRAAPAARS